MSSFSLPDGSGKVGKSGKTVATLFWEIFEKQKHKLPPQNDGVCLYFEVLSEENEMVVKQKSRELRLLGGRRMKDLKELSLEELASLYCFLPASPLNGFHSLEEVVEASKKLEGREKEGFVVVDKNFERVKVKSPSYLFLSHLPPSLSPSSLSLPSLSPSPLQVDTKQLVLLVKSSPQDFEFISYFPQFSERYNQVRESYLKMKKKLKRGFQKMREKSIRSGERSGNEKGVDRESGEKMKGKVDREVFGELASKTKFRELLFTLLEEGGEEGEKVEEVLDNFLFHSPLHQVLSLLQILTPQLFSNSPNSK